MYLYFNLLRAPPPGIYGLKPTMFYANLICMIFITMKESTEFLLLHNYPELHLHGSPVTSLNEKHKQDYSKLVMKISEKL